MATNATTAEPSPGAPDTPPAGAEPLVTHAPEFLASGHAGTDHAGRTWPSFVSSPVFAPAAVGATVLVGCAVAALWNPGDAGGFASCPTKTLLGVDCPFCGGTRAVAQLTRGNFARAADHNVVVVALAPIALAVWTVWMWSSITGRTMPTIKMKAWHGYAIATFLLVFTVVRNVKPGAFGAWLASERSS